MDSQYTRWGFDLPLDHESSRGLSNAEVEVLRYVRERGNSLGDTWHMEYRMMLHDLVARGLLDKFAYAGEGPGASGFSYTLTQQGMNMLLAADKGAPGQAKSIAVLSEIAKMLQ